MKPLISTGYSTFSQSKTGLLTLCNNIFFKCIKFSPNFVPFAYNLYLSQSPCATSYKGQSRNISTLPFLKSEHRVIPLPLNYITVTSVSPTSLYLNNSLSFESK